MRSLALAVSLVACLAHAQDPSSEADPASEASAPSPPPLVTPVPAPTPTQDPVFTEGFLSWNARTATATQGLGRTPLSREAFYALVGRPDLLLESERAVRRRIWLFVGAGVALSAGVVTAVAMFSTFPNLNSGGCVTDPFTYNGPRCIGLYEQKRTAGVAALSAGLAAAGLLVTFGFWSSPDVLVGDDAHAAVARYNAGLKQRATLERVRLRFAPSVGTDGAGLVAMGSF